MEHSTFLIKPFDFDTFAAGPTRCRRVDRLTPLMEFLHPGRPAPPRKSVPEFFWFSDSAVLSGQRVIACNYDRPGSLLAPSCNRCFRESMDLWLLVDFVYDSPQLSQPIFLLLVILFLPRDPKSNPNLPHRMLLIDNLRQSFQFYILRFPWASSSDFNFPLLLLGLLFVEFILLLNTPVEHP